MWETIDKFKEEDLGISNKILFKMLLDAKDKIIQLETGRFSPCGICSERDKIKIEIETELEKRLLSAKKTMKRIQADGDFKKIHYELRGGKGITPCPYNECYSKDLIRMVGTSACDECQFFKDRIFDTDFIYCKHSS